MNHHLTWRLGAAAGLLLTSFAVTAGEVIPQQEYDKYIDKHRTIQALDSSLFGEQINLRDGSLFFRVTDAELAGNGPPIRITRTLKLRENNRNIEGTGVTLMDGWQLEIPRLKTITNNSVGFGGDNVVGWQVPGTDKDKRCSGFARPGTITFADPGRTWDDDSVWWNGYQLVDDQGNEQELLAVSSYYPAVAGYKAVTTGNWRFECLNTTSNGEPGEGFKGTAPDGTKYWFDYLTYSSADSISKPNGSMSLQAAEGQGESSASQSADSSDAVTPMGSAPALMYRRYAMLLVTRIEDRFGNYLTYQYGPGAFTITASDGRAVSIDGAGNPASPKTVTLSSGPDAHTWTYIKDPATGIGTVTLPDNSKWSYNFSSLLAASPGSMNYSTSMCILNTINTGNSVTASATAPSGVMGTFALTYRRFGRSYTPTDCRDPVDGDGWAFIPADWFVWSLDSRSFSGPGMAAGSWTYTYSPSFASWSTACASGCTAEVWTDVSAPDGTRQRSTFSNRFNETENLLLKEETYNAVNTLMRTVRHEYATAPAGGTWLYDWPKFVGQTLMQRANLLRTERWAPASKNEIELGLPGPTAHTFTWQVPSTCGPLGTAPCFDKFARPIKVVKFSAP